MTEKQRMKSALIFFRNKGNCTGSPEAHQRCTRCMFSYYDEDHSVLCSANDAVDGISEKRPEYIMPIVTKYLERWIKDHPEEAMEVLL